MIRAPPPAVGDPFAYTFVDEATAWRSSTTCSGRPTATSTRCGSTSPGLAPRGPHRHDPGHTPAVGDPVGYTFVHEDAGLAEQHNLFRTGDGHIHALWFNFASGWHHEDRTAMSRHPARGR